MRRELKDDLVRLPVLPALEPANLLNLMRRELKASSELLILLLLLLFESHEERIESFRTLLHLLTR